MEDNMEPKDIKKGVGHIERMKIEKHELCVKITKLSTFLAGESSEKIDDIQWMNLKTQLHIMEAYCAILLSRIKYDTFKEGN